MFATYYIAMQGHWHSIFRQSHLSLSRGWKCFQKKLQEGCSNTIYCILWPYTTIIQVAPSMCQVMGENLYRIEPPTNDISACVWECLWLNERELCLHRGSHCLLKHMTGCGIKIRIPCWLLQQHENLLGPYGWWLRELMLSKGTIKWSRHHFR